MASEAQLPFDLNVALPRDGAERILSVTLIGGAAHPEEDDDDEEKTTLAPCCEVVELFSRAQEARILSGGRREARESMMTQVSREMPDAAISCTYHFCTRNIEPSSYLVLLALLAQTKYAYAPLEKLSIRTLTPGNVPLVVTKELLTYPGTSLPCVEEIPFKVEWTKSSSNRNRVVTYRFAYPVSREDFQGIAESINIWDHIAILGGFQLDFQEQLDLPAFGQTVQLLPNVIVHRIPHYEGYESGLGGLVNLGAKLHATGHPILAMEIE